MSLILLACSFAAGCGPSTSAETGASSSDAISELSTKGKVVGTWTDATYSTDVAPFEAITLKKDGSYSWTAPCRDKLCLAIEYSSGKWSMKEGDKATLGALGAYQIQLVDSFEQKTDYFVAATDEKITLSTQTSHGSELAIGKSFAFVPAGGSDTDSCQVDSDCSGALPLDVVTCSDGSTSGASWQCTAGTCGIAFCSNDGG